MRALQLPPPEHQLQGLPVSAACGPVWSLGGPHLFLLFISMLTAQSGRLTSIFVKGAQDEGARGREEGRGK